MFINHSRETNNHQALPSHLDVLVWNCNGASSKNFLLTIKDILYKYKPGVLGFLETKVSLALKLTQSATVWDLTSGLEWRHSVFAEESGYSGKSTSR